MLNRQTTEPRLSALRVLPSLVHALCVVVVLAAASNALQHCHLMTQHPAGPADSVMISITLPALTSVFSKVMGNVFTPCRCVHTLNIYKSFLERLGAVQRCCRRCSVWV
jgi:hypothetical protein